VIRLIREVAAEALFASPLQPSDSPTAGQVNTAVEEMLLLHGSAGCAALLAQEFGEHPGQAVKRMVWCLSSVRESVPA
jgi:hypothetical protein